MSTRWPVLLALFAALSCDGGAKDDPCPWLSGDNCWKASLEASAPCLHGDDEQGAFSADGTTCTYADGVVLTFDPPLNPGVDDFESLHVTGTRDGATCLEFTYEDTESHTTFELSTSLGTYNETGTRAGVDVSCPDGTGYTFDALAMLQCDGVFANAAGISVVADSAALAVFLNGGADGPVSLVHCAW